jgi:hypothetical protein
VQRDRQRPLQEPVPQPVFHHVICVKTAGRIGNDEDPSSASKATMNPYTDEAATYADAVCMPTRLGVTCGVPLLCARPLANRSPFWSLRRCD